MVGEKIAMSACNIYGTIGPSSMNPKILKELIQAGMTGIRLNLSHGMLEEMGGSIQNFCDIWKQMKNTEPDILIDLVGPELRIGRIDQELDLIENAYVEFSCNTDSCDGSIPVEKMIYQQLLPKRVVIIDDGKRMIEIVDSNQRNGEGTSEHKVIGKVIRGGRLSSKKSILIQGVEIENPTLTTEDCINLQKLDDYQISGIMLPFVRGKQDILNLKHEIQLHTKREIRILSKIENMEGVKKLEEIAELSDEIIIARGDLGNAVGLTKLPVIQDMIARKCRDRNQSFMIVTQMLASMESSPVPTRAEVNDIFQSICQGTSSVMLTGETANGQYPVEAVSILKETVTYAQQYLEAGYHI